MTVGELIEQLGGELVCGDASKFIVQVSDMEGATQTSLVFAETFDGTEVVLRCGAGAAVVPVGGPVSVDIGMTVVADQSPRLWFARAGKLVHKEVARSGIHTLASVGDSVQLGEGVLIGPSAAIGTAATIGAFTRIGAGAVVGDSVQIGKHCRIHPRVVIYAGTEIGDRVEVHAGAILGADGFGYVRDRATGAYTQFPQVGRLIIEDDVEIGANTTIDRGALRETRIRRGTKIDNLVHIGHNCNIGEDVVIAALTGISGSSSVGNNAVIAGQVGIGDHAHVGPGVVLGGQAGILPGKSVTTTGTVLWGTPAKPLREYLRELATLARLSKRKRG